MDALFGICGKDWVIVVADQSVNRSIFNLKKTEDKIMPLNNYKIIGAAGEQTDRFSFCNFIQKNIALREFRTGHELSVEASAEYMRSEMAYALRKGPFQVNILMAGYDTLDGEAKLYWMDYLGTLQRVTRGAHGYASYFVNSVLDNNWKEGMSKEEGMAAVKKCIQELRIRFIIQQHKFLAKVVTKEGTEVMELE